MSAKTISQSDTKIEALQLQSSAFGVVIPWGRGVQRIAGNLVWYGGFKAIPHTQSQGGKSGGVKVQSTSYTYQASVMMGICYGPIAGIPRVWRGKKLYSGDVLPAQVITVDEAYTPPGSGAMTYTMAHASAYLACLSVTYPYTEELESGSRTVYAALAPGSDYTVTAGVLTVLNGAYRGVALTVTYQYTSSAITRSGLTQLGLSFVSGEIGQAVWSGLSTFSSDQQIGYSKLALVAGANYDLGSGGQVDNHTFEVVLPGAYALGSSVPDVDPATAMRDLLVDASAGAAFPPSMLAAWKDWSDFCVASDLLVSPLLDTQQTAAEVLQLAAQLTNAAPVWSGGLLKMVPYGDSTVTANGRTFTPNTTPVYDLDDDAYGLPDNSGDAPVEVERKSPADRYNHVRVEFLNRNNQYNVEIAEAKDQADIDANGLRTMDTVEAHWICRADVARAVAQILLQRSLAVNATYTVPLSIHYSLAECADLVTLTDSFLAYSKLPVRILEIEETGTDGGFKIKCEDYPAGTAAAAVYPSQAGSGYAADYNTSPGSVSAPVLFEAPAALTASGLEVWAAVRGAGAMWGGCNVWASTDGGNTYRKVDTLYGGARYGTLSGAISGGVLPVTLLGGQLISGTAADAAALSTLCYIGGSTQEYLAFAGASFTGGTSYNLSGLVRGAYGTSGAAAHATNDPFVRCDDSIGKSGPLDLSMVGKTVYFKFTSFNVFGGGEESLASVTAYSYTVTGSMYNVSQAGAQSFYQETAPSAPLGIGSIWVQPSTGIMKRWNGSSWDAYSALGTSDVTLVARGNCQAAGNVITKVGGANAWDSDTYSTQSYTGGAFAEGVPAQANAALMFGLNSDPTTDQNYTSLDYALYGDQAGNLSAYESGTGTSLGSYAAGDVLTVAYDGSQVRYMKNGAVLRTVAAASGLKLYWDSSFWSVGAVLKGVRFGPMSANNWTSIGSRPMQFRVGATGFSASGNPIGAGLYNGETGALLEGAGRSYNLALIRRSDGAITFFDVYDIYVGGASVAGTYGGNSLAFTLNSATSASIVVIWTADEPQSYRLDATLLAAMKRNGASAGVFGSPQFKSRAAYVLIGIGGCGEGNGFECYAGAVDSDPNSWCDVSFLLTAQGQLLVTGTGATPRTLADYSYTGDLNATYGAQFGLNITGQAATSDLAVNAATEPQSSGTLSGSVSVPISGGGSASSTIATKSWTNSTGGSVTVQIEAAAMASVSWNSSYPSTAKIYIDYSSSGSGSGSQDVVPKAGDGLNSPLNFPGAITPSISVANGDTLTVNLKAQLVHTAGATLSWSGAQLRMTAIKR